MGFSCNKSHIETCSVSFPKLWYPWDGADSRIRQNRAASGPRPTPRSRCTQKGGRRVDALQGTLGQLLLVLGGVAIEAGPPPWSKRACSRQLSAGQG